jgi:hypothetical protein
VPGLERLPIFSFGLDVEQFTKPGKVFGAGGKCDVWHKWSRLINYPTLRKVI